MKRLGLLICSVILLTSCGSSRNNLAQVGLPMQIVYVVSEETSVPVIAEMAITEDQVKTGLMYRKSLPRERGMLFIFKDEAPRSFWMKNTLVPLDILFFDTDGSFVSSATMEPCTEDPCLHYKSEGLAQYALEVHEGFTELHSIGGGWKLLASQ